MELVSNVIVQPHEEKRLILISRVVTGLALPGKEGLHQSALNNLITFDILRL